ncbi:MAG: hypothetical protein Q7R91_02375 [bacterium]|nr:hypothetical protein [bacterium]
MIALARKTWHRFFGDFRARYIPLLMVYFAYGAAGFSAIAESFWVKEQLSLSARDLAVIGFWVGIPWTVKMVFGQFADSISIFGSRRKIYIFAGAGLIALGQAILIGLAAGWPLVKQFGMPENLFFLAAVVSVVGFVLQDVIADTMSTEVVDRVNLDGTPRPQEEVDSDLAQVQWLGRIALIVAGVLVSGIGGWLAQVTSYTTMFTLALFVPVISMTGAVFIRVNQAPQSPVNWWVLGGGLLFGVFVVGIKFSGLPLAEEIVFAASLGTLIFLISRIGISRALAFAAITLFLFRATPGAGPGVGWWTIDVLGFDKAFQGTLQQIGSILTLAGLFLFRKYIIEKPIGFTLAWLTVAGAIVSLPTIGLFYSIHEMIGVSARTIALVDTTIASPLGQLSMVPLLTLTARTCPKGNAGTWFALMASLMNLALSASQLGTKYLNTAWVVTREVRNASGSVVTAADYSNVGVLLITTWVIGLVVPLFTIWFFLRRSSSSG